MADTRDDNGRRHRAITLHREGVAFGVILERLGCARSWLAKWLQRYREAGWAGLQPRSRAPQRQWQRTPERVVAHILAIRATLEQQQTRRARFAGIGAEVVQLELRHQRMRPVPALSTIERILRRHGYPKRRPRRRKGGGEPYPAPRARRPGDLQQTDLVGPRHLRGPRGITRFYSVHTVALVGRGVAATQGRHKTAELLCEHFVHAWRWLGPPRISQMDNEMAATGGGRHPYSFSLVMRLHLLLGVHLLFIPPGEPGRNAHIESFNDLWQERVLRHPCPDLRALRRTSQAFLRYYHFVKPHRALQVAGDGTRYPGPWLAQHRAHLRTVPSSFSLAAYRDRHGRLRLPLARGRVSFIRRVDPQGTIDINGKSYAVGRRLAGRYIPATIFTHRRMLVVNVGPRRHKQFPFPISEPLVAPLVPLLRGRI